MKTKQSTINWDDWKYDSFKKRIYNMICICGFNRGYQRSTQRKLLCMTCGQKGKISGKKGKKLSVASKKRISKASLKWRKKQNTNYEKLTTLDKKIIKNIRCRIYLMIKNKPTSLSKSIGCTAKELRTHLESRFQLDMTWGNYGLYGWHIDHIVPLCNFDLHNPEEFKKAVHYSNLQPLWAKDNWSKGTK